LGRLPNINHRLALQYCRRQKLSDGHRHPPRPQCWRPPTGGWPAGQGRPGGPKGWQASDNP
jgi:hypothetical protein